MRSISVTFLPVVFSWLILSLFPAETEPFPVHRSFVKTTSKLKAGHPSDSFNNFLEHQDDFDPELRQALLAISEACSEISRRLAILPLQRNDDDVGGSVNVQGETQKEMDVVANDIFMEKLRPIVAALASEEEDTIVTGKGRHFEVAFDPLDGSSNLDVNLPTG
jgi:fructose-1,6-bisphosphatase